MPVRTQISTRFRNIALSTRLNCAAMLLMLVITSFLIGLLGFQIHQQNIENYLSELKLRAELNRDLVEDEIDRLKQGVLFLAKTPPINGIINASSNAERIDPIENTHLESWLFRLQTIFSAFAKANVNYFQIRFISAAGQGMEIVRVNSQSGQVQVVPPEQLQMKGQRDYVQETLKLKDGEVYLSAINLNRENGHIQEPHIRTLRAATPVYDSEKRLFGIVVINMNVAYLLDRIASDVLPISQVYLLNEQGDYLVHPDADMTFGFDLGQRRSWLQDFPELTLLDGKLKSGQTASFDRVHTAQGWIYLIQQQIIRRTPTSSFLTLIYVLPSAPINAQIFKPLKVIIPPVLAVMILLSVLYLFYIRRSLEPLKTLTAAAREIGLGHYHAVLPEIRSGELGLLIAALNHMSKQIEAHDLEIMQVNKVLSENEAYAISIVNSMPEGILVIDDSGRILRANSRVEQLFGYNQTDLLEQPVEMLIPARYRQQHLTLRNHYFTQVSKRMMGEGRDLFGLHQNGTEFPVEVGLSPMQVGGGRQVIVSIVDITARKAAEMEIVQLNKNLDLQVKARTSELQAANQELESFSYAVAHDLRAPLRAMMGFSQVLLEEYREHLDAEARIYLDQIQIGSHRMGELIDGLLSLSGSTRAELQRDWVDISVLAERLRNELMLEEQTRQVRWEIEPGLKAYGDGRMLEALMRNLLENALKYTALTTQAKIGVSSQLTADDLVLCVKDNGAGFDMAHADKLFQPFQRLHRQDEFVGIGIGLATVQRIIHRHGGEIKAESVPGQGAQFCFSLGEAAIGKEHT